MKKAEKMLTPEEITELFGLADADRESLRADIEAQKVANQNATDLVLIDKIEIILTILESVHVDPIEIGEANTKLRELIKRL